MSVSRILRVVRSRSRAPNRRSSRAIWALTDLAIRIGPLEDSTLTARSLGAAQMIYCASPAYLDANGAPAAPRALGDRHCIVVGNSPRTRWPFASPRGPIAVPVMVA